MATKKATRKTRVRSRPRLTIDLGLPLKRKIKVTAAEHNLTVSAYIARILEQALPGEEPVAKAVNGIITSSMLERAEALRKQQKEPFPEDSADLIREARDQRYARL